LTINSPTAALVTVNVILNVIVSDTCLRTLQLAFGRLFFGLDREKAACMYRQHEILPSLSTLSCCLISPSAQRIQGRAFPRHSPQHRGFGSGWREVSFVCSIEFIEPLQRTPTNTPQRYVYGHSHDPKDAEKVVFVYFCSSRACYGRCAPSAVDPLKCKNGIGANAEKSIFDSYLFVLLCNRTIRHCPQTINLPKF
jgi:hypothetical protein